MAICPSKIAARCRAAIVVVPRLFIGWRVRWRREERACGPAGAPQSLHRQISLYFSLKASISSVCVPSNTPRCLLFSSCFLLSLSLSLSSSPRQISRPLLFLVVNIRNVERYQPAPGSLLRSGSTIGLNNILGTSWKRKRRVFF